MPFPSDAFDVVLLAFGVPSYTDYSRSLSEAYRVLRPGGHLLATVYNARGLNILLREPKANSRNASVAAEIDPQKGLLALGGGRALTCVPFEDARLSEILASGGFRVLQMTTAVGLPSSFGPKVVRAMKTELAAGEGDPFVQDEMLARLDEQFCKTTGMGMYIVSISVKPRRRDHANARRLLLPAVYNCLGNRLGECTVLEHAPVRTSDDVKRVLGVPQDRVVKCLVLKSGMGQPVLAATPGDKRVDLRAVERATGQTGLTMAKPAEVPEYTGMALGSVCPLGLPPGVAMVIDSTLAERSTVYCGTGNNSSSLLISGRTLVELSGATVAAIAE